MKFILATKGEMTQKFATDGSVVPVTKLAAGPCVVTQLKTNSKDRYSALQIGYGTTRKLTKPLQGHFKGLGSFRFVKEFRLLAPADAALTEKIKVGDTITAAVFQAGDVVQVTGTSKGKGFQGMVKRYGFHGHPATHGHKDQLRTSGSIGAKGPAKVLKGTRMAGRMGGEQTTVKNLEIIEVDAATNELYVKGAVPGARGSLVFVSGVGDLAIKEVTEPPVAESAPVSTPTEPAIEPTTEEKPTVPAESTPA